MKKVFSILVVAMAVLALTTASTCNKNAQPAEEVVEATEVVAEEVAGCGACGDSVACAAACGDSCACPAEVAPEAAAQ